MNKEETIKDIQNIINANCWTISEQFASNVANAIYNAGYRKVPDGAVILTPEERDEELKACNEKQAELENEIKRLKADNKALEMWNDAYTEENEKLKKQNEIAHFFLDNALSHIDADKQIDNYMQASKEGAQEFAKKLKSKLHDLGDGGEKGAYLTENDIDNFLKEWLK